MCPVPPGPRLARKLAPCPSTAMRSIPSAKNIEIEIETEIETETEIEIEIETEIQIEIEIEINTEIVIER